MQGHGQVLVAALRAGESLHYNVIRHVSVAFSDKLGEVNKVCMSTLVAGRMKEHARELRQWRKGGH